MTTHLDLDALRALASCADAVAIPDAIARRMAAALLAAADEVERARTTIACLNRRCQKAEGIIARAGIVEGRDTASPHGRGSGRALANYAADMYRRERDEAVARLDALTGPARATMPAMASPHSPPPTKSLPALLTEIETAAQEAMRLHPHALHLRSVLALCDVTRRENACEEPDPSPAPPR